MHNLKLIIFITFALFSTINVNAQSVNQVLNDFQQTEFMLSFTQIQYQAQRSVRTFKNNEQDYDEMDLQNLKKAYNETAKQYNQLLANIKIDFLKKQKMKSIASMPHEYAKSLELDLRQLNEVYHTNYQQTLMDITGELDGSSIDVLWKKVIKFPKKMIQKIVGLAKASKHFKAEILESRLVEANRFLYWDEIQPFTKR